MDRRERPILFSGPMVRAILDGTKTQTRRVFARQPYAPCLGIMYPCGTDALGNPVASIVGPDYPDDDSDRIRNPYGVPRDRLWVREAWTADTTPEATRAIDRNREALWWHEVPLQYRGRKNVGYIHYAADGAIVHPPMADVPWESLRSTWKPTPKQLEKRRWRPSIHMPRWASRLSLEITRVSAEPLHDITENGARAEGCRVWTGRRERTAREAYAALWDDINGKRAPWASNPWVWVIEFKRVQP